MIGLMLHLAMMVQLSEVSDDSPMGACSKWISRQALAKPIMFPPVGGLALLNSLVDPLTVKDAFLVVFPIVSTIVPIPLVTAPHTALIERPPL